MPPYLAQLIRGELSSRELPEELDLSLLPADIIQCLCEQTAQHRLEYGTCIVWLEENRSLLFKHKVKATPERPLEIDPACDPDNLDDHPHGVSYVGFFHTHTPGEEGEALIGFSEDDYRATLADGENLSIVHNGREFFVLVRVQETWERGVVSPSVYRKWVKVFDDCLDNNELSTEEAHFLANRDICLQTKLAFYQGVTLQRLRRVL